MSEITKQLELNESAVARRILFLESYGDIERERPRSEVPNSWSVRVPQAAAAAAYLEALELQLVLDADHFDNVSRLATKASASYGTFGMGMAFLLDALFIPQRPVDSGVSLFAKFTQLTDEQRKTEEEVDWPEDQLTARAMRSSEQQMLVWLAGITHPNASDETKQTAVSQLYRSQERSYSPAYGVIGQPMRLYSSAALAALEIQPNISTSLDDHFGRAERMFVGIRSELVDEQIGVLNVARRSASVWENLLAYIPLVDFSLLAVTVVAARRSRGRLLESGRGALDVTSAIAPKVVQRTSSQRPQRR